MKPVCVARRRLLLGALTLALAACASTPPPAQPARPKVALALGGGAAKGFAHVGVIKVLESHGIRPDIITGTSAGGTTMKPIFAEAKRAKNKRVAYAEGEEERTIRAAIWIWRDSSTSSKAWAAEITPLTQ